MTHESNFKEPDVLRPAASAHLVQKCQMSDCYYNNDFCVHACYIWPSMWASITCTQYVDSNMWEKSEKLAAFK